MRISGKTFIYQLFTRLPINSRGFRATSSQQYFCLKFIFCSIRCSMIGMMPFQGFGMSHSISLPAEKPSRFLFCRRIGCDTHSLVGRLLVLWRTMMRLVVTRDARTLSGLTSHQLREWTTRRAIIPADRQSRGHGRPAEFSWQTILLLRIALELRTHFHVELGAYREFFSSMRDYITSASFIGLWGTSLHILSDEKWAITNGDYPSASTNTISIPLNKHLAVLSVGFSFPTSSVEGQFDLFPVQDTAGVNRPTSKLSENAVYDSAVRPSRGRT